MKSAEREPILKLPILLLVAGMHAPLSFKQRSYVAKCQSCNQTMYSWNSPRTGSVNEKVEP